MFCVNWDAEDEDGGFTVHHASKIDGHTSCGEPGLHHTQWLANDVISRSDVSKCTYGTSILSGTPECTGIWTRGFFLSQVQEPLDRRAI